MIKVGDIVKLKNPKSREKKRRWRVIDVKMLRNEATGIDLGTRHIMRRIDTTTHRLEKLDKANLVPISFWERITKRY